MKLGMPILFEYDSLIDNVKLAKQLGFEFIELNLNFSCCRDELSNKEIIEYLINSDLEFTIHFFDEFDAASYDEVVEGYIKILENYLELSKDLNIKLLNIHLNEGPIVTISGIKNYLYEKEYNLYISKLKNNLSKIKKLLNKYNIELVLENVKTPNFIVNTYIDLVKEGFSFNYDIGHDYIDKNIIIDLIDKHNLKFNEFHFHDAMNKKCHLVLGEGNMNLSYYKSLITDQYVVLEVKSSNDLIKSIKRFNEI
ncbi:MAG: sugar phosphate isomerase/epimerase [Erysipelotrichaceae bacterium]|nr:sugar phosphate isomerase/epimerase [Erysipelotrichaceae bacterium]